MPFQVTFDIDTSDIIFLNASLPLWKKIEEQLGLEIHFTRSKNKTSVSLKCSQSIFPLIRHQMLALIELLSQKRGVSNAYVAFVGFSFVTIPLCKI